MAHLIKIEDYTSRYLQDMQRYLSQFSRLKKEQWQNMKREWIKQNERNPAEEKKDETLEDWLEEAQHGMIHTAVNRLKNFTSSKHGKDKNEKIEEEPPFYYGKSLEEVKELFYDDLYMAQLRWASASLLEESQMNPAYKYDQTLRFLLRQLPDNYMIFYYPIFSVGRAPLEMDIMVIGPTDIYCICCVTGDPNSVFETSSGRYWNEYVNQERSRKINPVIALNRMSSVVQSILKEEDSTLELHRVVWSPSSIIDHRAQGMKVEMVDKRNQQDWFEKRQRNPSPIKKDQLHAARILLEHTLTTSFRRRDIMENVEKEE